MKPKIIIFILALFAISINNFAQDGATLYRQGCAACHSIGKGRLVGPDLKGITEKRKEAWLIKWIKSSQTLIDAGDKDAQEIYAQYNEVPMPDQDFSDVEIKSILTFIKSQSGGEVTSSDNAKVVASTPSNQTEPVGESNIATNTSTPEATTSTSTQQTSTTSTINGTPSNTTDVKVTEPESSLSSFSLTTYLLLGLNIILVILISVLGRVIRNLSMELANKSEK